MSIKDVKQIGVRIANGSKKAQAPIDATAIRELADLLTETGLTEIEIEQGGQRLRVARQPARSSRTPRRRQQQQRRALPRNLPVPVATFMVRARSPRPMVGVVYLAPEPGAPPFVRVGQTSPPGRRCC